jgi:hypothetical protein
MTTEQKQKGPAMIAYSVRPGARGKKDSWTRIGAVWPHKDGKGFDVSADAWPAAGCRLVLRLPSEPEQQDGEGA